MGALNIFVKMIPKFKYQKTNKVDDLPSKAPFT